MIERLDGRSVDHFCRDEIFEPLGMTDATFEPGPARDRLADLRFRNGSGEFIDYDLSPPSSPEVYRLGSALYGTSRDYIRFVRMILNNGELDGNRVVTPSSLNAMMINQIGELSVEMKTTAPDRSVDVDLLFGTRITHTIGFMRNEENIPGMRDAGSLGWAGVANTHYWIDPAKDIAAVFMTQLLPFCDPRLMDFYHEFERAVYERFVGATDGPGAARPKVGEAGR
jgi:CubicO group peptidase (beta-lactamase class C family)